MPAIFLSYLHLIRRGFYLGALWLILCEGDLKKSWIGICGVIAGLLIQSILYQMPKIPLWKGENLLRLIPYFILTSLRGGVDVALRALSPSMHINPGFLVIELQQTKDSEPLTFLMVVLGLFPGTICVGHEKHRIHIHALDLNRNLAIKDDIRRLEKRVALLYR